MNLPEPKNPFTTESAFTGAPPNVRDAIRKAEQALKHRYIFALKAAIQSAGYEIKSPGWLPECRSIVHVAAPQLKVAVRVLFSNSIDLQLYRQEWEDQGWHYHAFFPGDLRRILRDGGPEGLKACFLEYVKALKGKGK